MKHFNPISTLENWSGRTELKFVGLHKRPQCYRIPAPWSVPVIVWFYSPTLTWSQGSQLDLGDAIKYHHMSPDQRWCSRCLVFSSGGAGQRWALRYALKSDWVASPGYGVMLTYYAGSDEATTSIAQHSDECDLQTAYLTVLYYNIKDV